MAVLPVGVWGLHVPAEAGPVPAISEDIGDVRSDALVTFRITMAALDPTAKPLDKDAPKRATLKILRRKLNLDNMLGSDSEDEDEDEDEESEDEEVEVAKSAKLSKKEKKEAIKKTIEALAAEEKMDVDGDKKEDDEDDSDEEEDDESYEVEEFVMCTLDPEKHYQQALDIAVGEDEEVMFQVIGNYDIYLTGNIVENRVDYDSEEDSDDEENDYDLSPSEEELLYGNGADSESESEDGLDAIADPRIQEVDTDEEEKPEAKKLTKAEKKALKRTADELEPESTPEKKLSKKQLKKLKANDGKPVENAVNETPESKKKVQFAKELEQGPSSAEKKPEKKEKKEKKEEKKEEKKTKQTRVVDGVTIEDRTIGKGPAAKPGNKVEMRYIGKLLNGKQFDSNIKGKAFSFKLGAGDVIRGWDIGVKGMQIGGERRLSIPPALGYGKKSLPGIPSNSTLVFDIKLLAIK